MYICDFGNGYQLLGVIFQHSSRILEFTTVEPLDVDEFPDFWDKLAGPFESHFFYSYVIEIRLLCTCEGCRNET